MQRSNKNFYDKKIEIDYYKKKLSLPHGNNARVEQDLKTLQV